MKASKDNILKLAKKQLDKNRLEIRHLRKTATRKGTQRFSLAYPHLIARLDSVDNGKVKLSVTGARCLLLENKKSVGSIDFIQQKSGFRFSHISFDKEFSKVLAKLLEFIRKRSKVKDPELAQTIELIPFGTPALKFKINGKFEYLRTDTKGPYQPQTEADIGEYLAGLLSERHQSEKEFRNAKNETRESRLRELREFKIL
jgi:hypothetical protein